jgi:hypothetical protein
MAGQILQNETKVAWASRTNSPTLARADRLNPMQSATPSDTRSPRILLPPAEHRFVDDSPSPYPTQSPAPGRSSDSQLPLAASEGVAPLSPDGHHGLDIDGMYIPGVSNDPNGLQTPNRQIMSAPAELHQLHRKITMDTPETRFSAGVVPDHHGYQNRQLSKMRIHSTPIQKHAPPFQLSPRQAEEQLHQASAEFNLDSTAPIRALRHPPASASAGAGAKFSDSLMGTIEEQRGQSGTPDSLPEAPKKGEHPEVEDEPERIVFPGQVDGAIDRRAGESATWGEPFKLQWIKTERLPFYRTRHLRNPWNHDREIKVSRDGTELEPSVGQALLDEWDRVIEAPQTEKASQQAGQGGTDGGGRQQGRSKGGGIGGGSQRAKR